MGSRRVLIVGGVAGGASCAARLRRMDEHAEIFLFERGPDVSFANCGLPYYIGNVIPKRQDLLVATPERFRDWFRIEVRTQTEVENIDRQRRTITLRNIVTGATGEEAYDVLVLSPGAMPVRPRLPGVGLPGVFSIRNLVDADRVRHWVEHRKAKRAVVVGGGFIGLEMVENLHRLDVDITLLERLGQVMPQMDAEMVAPVHDVLQRFDVDLQLFNGVVAFEPGEQETVAVVAESGHRFVADVVILAMGVKPDVALARHAGLEIGSLGGIRVDDQMRTSDPAIFAVGDAVEMVDFVTGQPALVPLAGPANRQGRVVADVIAGRDARFRGAQGTAVVGVFGVTLAMTGATEKTLQKHQIPYQKVYTHSLDHAGYYPGAELITMKLLFAPGDGRILGAQAVGKGGVDKRIDVVAMAIQKRASVLDLEEAELCYAPQYGSAKDPVNIGGFVAANILRGDVEPASWAEWKRRHAEGGPMPVVVDVRTPTEFAASAVPAAINIPLGELRQRLGELPREQEIWVHCGVGQRSYYASRILKQHGFQVRNLSGGMRSYQMEV